MTITWSEVPEYVQALAQENASRDSAFFLEREQIAGISVLPFAPRHLLILDNTGCPFIRADRCPNVIDLARFLWVVSPGYVPRPSRGLEWRRWWFVRRLRRLIFLDVCAAIQRYLEESLMDAPGGESKPGAPSDYSLAAGIVDLLAREYGWAEKDILTIPFKRLWQYARAIRRHYEPNCAFINPLTDRAKREHFHKRCAQN